MSLASLLHRASHMTICQNILGDADLALAIVAASIAAAEAAAAATIAAAEAAAAASVAAAASIAAAAASAAGNQCY